MNLVRGGHFAPSLELKLFVSIETHPTLPFTRLARGCRRSAPQAKARLPSPCPGLYPRYSLAAHISVGTPATLCACAAKARTRLSGAFQVLGDNASSCSRCTACPGGSATFKHPVWDLRGSLMRGLFGFKLGAVQQALTWWFPVQRLVCTSHVFLFFVCFSVFDTEHGP